MWVAPMMSTRAGGTMACTNTSPSGVSMQLALAALEALADGVVHALVVAAEHLVPAVGEARAHDDAAPVGAGIERPGNQRQTLALLQPLDEHLDLAAAGQADLPGGLVGDAELQRLGLAAGKDILGLGDHLALDAAAGDRALEAAVLGDHQLAADADRRRAPGADHGGERDAAVLVEPAAGGLQHVVRLGAVEGGRGLGHGMPRLSCSCRGQTPMRRDRSPANINGTGQVRQCRRQCVISARVERPQGRFRRAPGFCRTGRGRPCARAPAGRR